MNWLVAFATFGIFVVGGLGLMGLIRLCIFVEHKFNFLTAIAMLIVIVGLIISIVAGLSIT